MLTSNAPRPASRRPRGVAVVVALAVAGLAPVLGPTPAGATPIPTPAPLVTTDGIGVRVDEAVFAPVVAETEAAIEPLVEAALHDRGVEVVPPPSTVVSLDVTADVDLTVDLVEAGTTGFPDGGLAARADVVGMELDYVVATWWSTCSVHVALADGYVETTAPIDRDPLPGSPLPFGSGEAKFDDDPVVWATPFCSSFVSGWFADFFGSSEVTTEAIAGHVVDELQGAIDGVWDDHVTPVLDALPGGFDLEYGQVRTDDHGLIATADTDATAGLTIPGLGGPYAVSNALGAWVPSTIDDLLENREDGAIVTIHPNVANQYLYALTQALSGQFGTLPVSVDIEDLLLKPGVHGSYDDGGWTVSMGMVGSTTAPSAHPTGPDGAPELRYELIDLTVHNTSYTTGPVAVFRGSITDTFDPGTATVSLSLHSGNPDVVTWDPDPAVMTPYARDAVAAFASVFAGYPSLGPTALGDLTWCPTCTRYSGDQRYTATLLL